MGHLRCTLQWGTADAEIKDPSVQKPELFKGRQQQGMDRPGVRQVPEGSGELGKMEKTGCKIICGGPTTLAVKGLMMMMMMTAWGRSEYSHAYFSYIRDFLLELICILPVRSPAFVFQSPSGVCPVLVAANISSCVGPIE